MPEIDTTNRFMVAARGNGELVIMMPPLAPLSTEDALTLAAWIVAVTGEDERFAAILAAVQST